MSFSFGTPSSAPASSSLGGGGFNFGAAKPATPGFGLAATSQPSTGLFGAPATSTPAFGSATPAFGTSAAPTFGSTAAPAFGAASAAPSFGATTTPAFGSLPGFGAGTTPAFGAAATPAFGAGTTPAFGAGTTPAFGAGTTPAFGAGTTPAFGATSAAPTFGSTATPAFGATTTPAFGTSTAPAFGATTTPAFGSTGLGTGGLNFGAGTNTSTQGTGLSFAAPSATTTSTGLGGLGGIGFGATTSAQNTSLGLFGAASTATTTNSLFGGALGTTSVIGSQPPTLTTSSFGLGGVAPIGGIGVGNADAKTEPPKQQKLPNEISTTIDSFKEFVKKQKSLSSEMMRVSIKPLHKVARDADATLRVALSLSGEVSRARAHSRRLRAAAAAALAAAEAAARDSTAQGLELDSNAPPSYVKELISELEQQLITFRRQMEVADKQMQSSPKLLTEQELTLGIRRMHESLVALAGRLQAVHTQVEAQKEQYLNLRKYVLKDPTNVFDAPSPSTSLDQILKDAESSRKKIKTGNLSDTSFSSAVLADPRAALGNIQQLAGPSPFTYFGSTLSPFPAADASGPGWQPPAAQMAAPFAVPPAADPPAFQLQKPPGKRGKQ